MKKSLLFYGFLIASYIIISKKLKDKDSELSKSVKKCAEKLTCMLNKMTESNSSVNEEGKRGEEQQLFK